MKTIQLIILFIGILTTFSACKKEDKTIPTVISPGNDPNFTIVANSDTGFSNFNRKVVVFGIDIYAVASVENAKLLLLLRRLTLLQSWNNNLNHLYDHRNYLQQYFLLEDKLNLIQGQSI